MNAKSLQQYGWGWVVLLGLFLLFAIRFLGVPIILEHPKIESQEVEWIAQAASAGSVDALLAQNQTSRYWGWGICLLIFAAMPLLKGCLPQDRTLRLLWGTATFWVGWVFVSSFWTVSADLSFPTVLHVFLCWGCFCFLGLVVGRYPQLLRPLLWILSGALVSVMLVAFQQHYGGLEQVRNSILAIVPPENLTEKFMRRITSQRVYGTMVYPNSLAGLLLLLLPPCLCALWELPSKVPNILRLLAVGILGYMGLACLFWSGSKTAWLILIFLGIVLVFLRVPIARKYKVMMAALILCIGLCGFVWTFSDYFKRGATSVGARFDYWAAAALNIKEHPLLGSGPGTFAIPYGKTKNPDSEMARLCHNDYLEQATDSGLPAAVAYIVFIAGCLYTIWRRHASLSLLQLALALGISGFVLQGFSEFSLYIPAIAWPFFILLGALITQRATLANRS